MLLLVLWIALLAEATLLAPPSRPDQTAWLVRLVTGAWGAEEPWVVVLFNLMGIWPVAMGALLAGRLRRRPVPLWPFAVASMALGAFVLLPGLALGGTPLPARHWQGWLGGRAVAVVGGVGSLGLLGWGATAGSLDGFAAIWASEQFVHVMALDFVALWATSVLLAHHLGGPWLLTSCPLVGACAYRAVVPLTTSYAGDREAV